MLTATTNGITVSVEHMYLPQHSNPLEGRFVFGYHIAIENASVHTVQLLRRTWRIANGDGTVRVVEGEGVVGVQPVLEPGAVHRYTSFCNLYTEVGRMVGTYQMCRLLDGQLFDADIPAFTMVMPDRLN